MFYSSFATGVAHRQVVPRISTGDPIVNAGYIEVIGKGIQYPNTLQQNLGTNYKYPTLVLNVGGFSNANEESENTHFGGALCLAIPDGTSKGGNFRGHSSIDLQSNRSAPTQVASGINSVVIGATNSAPTAGSVAIGYGNTASGSYSHAKGYSNIASGSYSHAIGYANRALGSYSHAIGYANAVHHHLSYAFGRNSTSRCTESIIFGNRGVANTAGKSMVSLLHYLCTTTDGTTEVTATTDTASASAINQYVFGTVSTILVSYRAIGITSTAETTVIEGKFCMKKGTTASTTALVGAHTSSKTYGDSALDGAIITVTANTTLGCPKMTIKGVASKTIRWNCSMNIEEVGY